LALLIPALKEDPLNAVTIDGGPHTLWWPVQNSDGSIDPFDAPPVQLLREMQPFAKMIVTVTDPVQRMYSDYYFIDDDLHPVEMNIKQDKMKARKRKMKGKGKSESNDVGRVDAYSDADAESDVDTGGSVSDSASGVRSHGEAKSAEHFHRKAWQQVASFYACLRLQGAPITPPALHSHADLPANSTATALARAQWVRAAQVCAHDRRSFAIGGSGRLSIGLYALYYLKWLEHFNPAQFLFMRLEAFADDPKAYMNRVFSFMDVALLPESASASASAVSRKELQDWDSKVLRSDRRNRNKVTKEPMLDKTRQMLADFYRPYDELLLESIRADNGHFPAGWGTGPGWGGDAAEAPGSGFAGASAGGIGSATAGAANANAHHLSDKLHASPDPDNIGADGDDSPEENEEETEARASAPQEGAGQTRPEAPAANLRGSTTSTANTGKTARPAINTAAVDPMEFPLFVFPNSFHLLSSGLSYPTLQDSHLFDAVDDDKEKDPAEAAGAATGARAVVMEEGVALEADEAPFNAWLRTGQLIRYARIRV